MTSDAAHASEASDDEDDGPADSASSAVASAATPPRYGAPGRTRLPPRPKHYVNRTVHRKH